MLWEHELDARILGRASWDRVASRGFDRPDLFSAYLHTLRWSCVTATDPELFQAPYRAGIEVKAYQLEPLRKALAMPRVNLFIADDVGLGKTIEAGLILREMLLRQRVRQVVVACPPSVVRQWQEEMEQRFGLTFVIFDRDYVAACRRERGYGVNPWTTHTRFIISHPLLRDEAYAAPCASGSRDTEAPSLLILDEAHNAAPPQRRRYAVDSHFTRAIRELAQRFEHRLFLSATPHNGHSNSFSALLEILDPDRFCRGVQPDGRLLDEVMVRRLKSDLREISTDDFPDRRVVPEVIDHLPDDAPELTSRASSSATASSASHASPPPPAASAAPACSSSPPCKSACSPPSRPSPAPSPSTAAPSTNTPPRPPPRRETRPVRRGGQAPTTSAPSSPRTSSPARTPPRSSSSRRGPRPSAPRSAPSSPRWPESLNPPATSPTPASAASSSGCSTAAPTSASPAPPGPTAASSSSPNTPTPSAT
ncbi:SNF2-related protein [Nannocystis sp.]|uniref:SNF2-related protein n=1 Tax=Nannocystis sp. TaxID=1962667 RepID=UPI0025E11BC8|nr:SNF2-related protein [Nannocystis sp.]